MARIRKKGLIGILIVLIVLAVGGYIAKSSFSGRSAQAPDSTADSTMAVADDTTGADKDKKGKKGKKGDKDEKKEPDPVPIEIATVEPREISSFYYTTATMEPERKVAVVAKLAGIITKIHVEEGDVVKRGQILCQLDDQEERIAFDEARINRNKQKQEFDRLKNMFDEKIISDKEFTDAKYQFEIAENQFQAAALRYEYTKITAPFGGIITKRFIETGQDLRGGGQSQTAGGQSMSTGLQLFEIVDVDPLLVRMFLPENEVRDIRVGQVVNIHPDNAPDKPLTGTVIRIAPEVDQRTGTVKVTAECRGGGAVPGSFARIKIVTDIHTGSLTIPRRGLISDAGDLFVFIAEADTVRKSTVRVGYQDEDFAEMLSGVERGDSVVVIGTGGLRTGTKVKVVDPTMQEELSKKDKVEESASN